MERVLVRTVVAILDRFHFETEAPPQPQQYQKRPARGVATTAAETDIATATATTATATEITTTTADETSDIAAPAAPAAAPATPATLAAAAATPMAVDAISTAKLPLSQTIYVTVTKQVLLSYKSGHRTHPQQQWGYHTKE